MTAFGRGNRSQVVDWLRRKDPQLLALRRAARTAVVMPALFAFGDRVVDIPQFATFAAFGSFATLLLAEFGGTRAERFFSQALLAVAGAVLVTLGTLAGEHVATAVVAMAVVGFAVLFAGVVSSVLAGATTALLLAFVLPVATPAALGDVGWRVAGWTLAAAVASVAAVTWWPAPARLPLRGPVVTTLRALADRMRVGVTAAKGDLTDPAALDVAIARARGEVEAMREAFYATPYRPSSLTTPGRMLVRLVDELIWLGHMLEATDPADLISAPRRSDPHVCAVKAAAADVLDRAAELLADPVRWSAGAPSVLVALDSAVEGLERHATTTVPLDRRSDCRNDAELAAFVSSLEPAFRAQEAARAIAAISGNVTAAVAAERRSWWQRLLGQQPTGVAGTLAAAHTRAAGHVDRHSVWLHNSLRGAAGLALAVLVADLTGVQHSFWVVLGTLSVLRSNALSTGQNVARGLLGTTAGVLLGGLLVSVIGSSTELLWALLPVAIFVAGVTPAAVGFAAGQAAFSLTLLILFNIIEPAGWQVGLVRVEDIAIGGAVSLAVGVLFWPRGAGPQLRQALATAYGAAAGYLREATALAACTCQGVGAVTPAAARQRARAASLRLDDAFRTFLSERGAKAMPLADVTTLVTGVTGLRLAADAVTGLWVTITPDGDRRRAAEHMTRMSIAVAEWYDALAATLGRGEPLPSPRPVDAANAAQLLDDVRADLTDGDGAATETGVRIVWTCDHLDVARRLQEELVRPARRAARTVAPRRRDPDSPTVPASPVPEPARG